jgi:hypothetical protein
MELGKPLYMEPSIAPTAFDGATHQPEQAE